MSYDIHVSEKDGDVAEDDEIGALPGIDAMPDGKGYSGC
jgi:hypothetical protein